MWENPDNITAGVTAYAQFYGAAPQYLPESPDAVWSYNIGAAMNGVGNISMYRVLGQFAAITVGGGAGWALKGGYTAIGATAGAIGGGRATNWSPSGMLFGAAIGSLTAGDADGLSGIGAVEFSSLVGGTAGFTSTVSMNAWTGEPILQNSVRYGYRGSRASG